jgi:hypothetical protein
MIVARLMLNKMLLSRSIGVDNEKMNLLLEY